VAGPAPEAPTGQEAGLPRSHSAPAGGELATKG
jgi:hypothetical protein